MTPEAPRVLCVDDEPNVLEGLQLHLRRKFALTTATSGAEGLEKIKASAPFAAWRPAPCRACHRRIVATTIR